MTLWMLAAALASEGTPPDLTGRHVMTLNVISRAKVPIIGWISTRTVTTVLLDIEQHEGGWFQQHEVCDLQILNEDGKPQAFLPLRFVKAMPKKRYSVAIAARDGGWSYVADLGEDHIGYDPTVAQQVPERPGDPGVLDPDRDGHPGMTVRLKVPVLGLTNLYIAQRGWLRIDGSIESADRVRGSLEVAVLQQRTLKASNPLFSLSPRIEPVAGESWFSIQRDPDATCAQLRPPRPTDEP